MTTEVSRPVALKVDVDTHDGMRDGVPRLLETLGRMDIKATFFLSFGPDNAGKAIFRLFKDPSFLKKMVKTKAPSLYGLRTVLSGTILPPRPIATAFPELVRQIAAEGHEVQVHAWDHRKWQDHLDEMSEGEIEREYTTALNAYKEILGRDAGAVASPGWQATEKSLMVEEGLGLTYASDFRDGVSCFPVVGEQRLSTLQIPTTGPCLEELLTMGITAPEELVERLLAGLRGKRYPVLALHAEVEGGPFQSLFMELAAKLLKAHGECVRLMDFAKEILRKPQEVPLANLIQTRLDGRAGLVASSRILE